MNTTPGEWSIMAEYDPRVDAEAIEMLIAALRAAEDRMSTVALLDGSKVAVVIGMLIARMKARIEV